VVLSPEAELDAARGLPSLAGDGVDSKSIFPTPDFRRRGFAFSGGMRRGGGSTAVVTTAQVCRACRGFVGEQEYNRFLEPCPVVEKDILDAGITLIKIWLEVSIE
jgi:hypothetical protein